MCQVIALIVGVTAPQIAPWGLTSSDETIRETKAKQNLVRPQLNKYMPVHATQGTFLAGVCTVLFQILGWDPSTGAPDSIDQINIKSNLPLMFFHAPLCLLLSAFFLLASDQIWLGSVASYVSICLGSQCLQTWLWVSRAGFHRNQDSSLPLSPRLPLLPTHLPASSWCPPNQILHLSSIQMSGRLCGLCFP